MPSVVIVTKQCYLLCEAINFIVINELEDDEGLTKFLSRLRSKKKSKTKSKPPKSPKLKDEYIKLIKPYQIIINFEPKGQPTHNQASTEAGTQVAITVQGLERTIALFQEMVAQIREQIPDQMFLDKLVREFLTGIE
jgi:hypothetical protein